MTFLFGNKPKVKLNTNVRTLEVSSVLFLLRKAGKNNDIL